MIVTVGGIKGGCGKSTISIGLAILRSVNSNTLLVDADTQCSASDFTLLRTERTGSAGYTCVQLTGRAVRSEVLKLAEHYGDIIIDVAGRDTAGQRAALSISNVLIIPVVPRAFDVWTLDQFGKLVEEMRPTNPGLVVWTFLNRKEHSGPDNDDAIAILEAHETLEFKSVALGDRKVFGRAAAVGLGVGEYKPRNDKAIVEMDALYCEVFDIK
jgi:chromosome partitioning protein